MGFIDLTASNTNSNLLIFNQQIIQSGIQLQGENGFSSSLIIQDNVGDSSLQTSSLQILGGQDPSKIGPMGVLVLNSDPAPNSIGLALDGITMIVEDGGVMEWQRGVIQGTGSPLVLINPGGLLDMSQSNLNSSPQRVLDDITMEINGDWVFISTGEDFITCNAIFGANSDIVELVALQSDITLGNNGVMNVLLESTFGHTIEFSSTQFLMEDTAQLIGGSASFVMDSGSSWTQSGFSTANVSILSGTDSTLTLQDASSLRVNEGSMNVENWNIELQNNTEFVFSNSSIIIDDSQLNTRGESTLLIDNETTLRMDAASSGFSLHDSSSFIMQGESKTEVVGSIFINDSSSIVISDKSTMLVDGIRLCDIDLTYKCFCNCNTTASTTVECTSGVSESACLGTCLASPGLECIPGQTCEQQLCDGFCEPTCGTGFQVDGAVLSLGGTSSSLINESIFQLSFGRIVLSDQHKFQLLKSEMKMKEGNFSSIAESTLDFVFGELEVAGGNIFFLENSRLRAVNASELEVQSGSIQFDNNSQSIMVASEIELTGGDLLFLGNSSFTSSALPIGSLEGLDFEPGENGRMYVGITTGLMLFSGTSTASFQNNTIVEVFGTFQMIETATFIGVASTFDIFSKEECQEEIVQCNCTCALLTTSYDVLCAPGLNEEDCEGVCISHICLDELNGDCGNCEEDCVVSCPSGLIPYDGAVVLEGDSTAMFQTSNVTIDHGSMRTSGSHQLSIDKSNVMLSNGVWLSEQSSSVTMIESELLIQEGGEFTMMHDSQLIQENSSIEVFGSVFLSGKSIDGFNATITVRNGSLTFGGSGINNYQRSQILLEETGNIIIDENSISEFRDTRIQVTNGTLFLLNEGRASITQASTMDISSSVVCNGSSSLTMDGSEATVRGNLSLSDSSRFEINSSVLNVGTTMNNSGNLFLSGNSVLSVQKFSNASLTGNLELSGSSNVKVDGSSSITVIGNGLLTIFDSSSLDIDGNSVVSIQQGTVEIYDQGTINISNNSLLLANDILDLRGPTAVSLPFGNRFIVDTQGVINVRQYVNITSSGTSSSTNPNSAPRVENSGIFDLSTAEGGDIFVPIDNTRGGMVAMGRANYNLVNIMNSGMVFFDSSSVNIVDESVTRDPTQRYRQPLHMQKGSQSQGRLTLRGDFVNDGELVHDQSTGSLFEIEGTYCSSKDSTVYITILNPKSPGDGYTFVNVGQSAELAGTAEICIPNSADFGSTKSLDVFKFANRLGKFDTIKFKCSPQHISASYSETKAAKLAGKSVITKQHTMMKAVSGGCASTEYTSGSFSVLFNGCGGGSKSEQQLYMWLSLGFAIGAILIFLVIVVVYDRVPIVRRFIGGKESARIERVREVKRKLKNGSGGDFDGPSLSTQSDTEMVL